MSLWFRDPHGSYQIEVGDLAPHGSQRIAVRGILKCAHAAIGVIWLDIDREQFAELEPGVRATVKRKLRPPRGW